MTPQGGIIPFAISRLTKATSPQLAALSPAGGNLDPKPVAEEFILLADRLERVCMARRGESAAEKLEARVWASQQVVTGPRRGNRPVDTRTCVTKGLWARQHIVGVGLLTEVGG